MAANKQAERRESRLVTRPADEFRVVRRSTEPTAFVEPARARSM
jgi:hypothetical protein